MRSAADTPAGDAAIGAWRQGVQRAMLQVAAFIAPPIVIATVFLRWGSWTRLDTGVMGGVSVLVLVCCAARGPLATRARVLLVTAFTVGLYFLGRNGLAGGLSVALIALSIFASLSTSRSMGIAFIVITLVAY